MSESSAHPRAWWHGCWLEAGHYLHDVDGRNDRRMIRCPLQPTGSMYDAPYLDGGLAPRRLRDRFYPRLPFPAPDDRIVYTLQGGAAWEQRYGVERASDECPQGEFLLHAVAGCTIAAWWDRTQGDERGACNSCLIVEGDHEDSAMLALFPQLFPRQATRLAAAGVELRFLRWGVAR